MIILLAALKRVTILSDFKTVTKKFEDQGIDFDIIESYLSDFKKLKDQNKITDVQKKDIDFWGTQKFEDFISFIVETQAKKSKSEERKLEKAKGAELIAENGDWVVYKITTHKAAMLYGSGTKWCITEEEGYHWKNLASNSIFYFILNKKPDNKEEPFYKIALQIDEDGKELYWDALDNQHNHGDVEAVENTLGKIPDFKREPPKETLHIIRQKIKSGGLTPDVLKYFKTYYAIEPIAYFPENNFLVFNKYDGITELADQMCIDNLLAALKPNYISRVADISDNELHSYIDDILARLAWKYKDLYKKLVNKIIEDGIANKRWLAFCKEYDEVEIDNAKPSFLNAVDSDSLDAICDDPTEILASYIYSEEVQGIFAKPIIEEMLRQTENDLFGEIEFRLNSAMNVRTDDIHGDIYVGLFTSAMDGIGPDLEDFLCSSIQEDFKNLKVRKGRPTTMELTDAFIESLPDEYLKGG